MMVGRVEGIKIRNHAAKNQAFGATFDIFWVLTEPPRAVPWASMEQPVEAHGGSWASMEAHRTSMDTSAEVRVFV